MKTPSVNYTDYSKKDNPKQIAGIHATSIMLLSFLAGIFFCLLNNIEYSIWAFLANAFFAFLNTCFIMAIYIDPRYLKNELWLGYKTTNFLYKKLISFKNGLKYSLIKVMNKMPWQNYNRKLLDILQNEVKNINDTFFEDKNFYHSYEDYSLKIKTLKSTVKENTNMFNCTVLYKDEIIAEFDFEINSKSKKITKMRSNGINENQYHAEIKKTFPEFKKEFKSVIHSLFNQKPIIKNKIATEKKDYSKNNNKYSIKTSNITLLNLQEIKNILDLKLDSDHKWLNKTCDKMENILNKINDAELNNIDMSAIEEIIYVDLLPLILDNLSKHKFISSYESSNDRILKIEETTQNLIQTLEETIDKHINKNIDSLIDQNNLKINVHQYALN